MTNCDNNEIQFLCTHLLYDNKKFAIVQDYKKFSKMYSSCFAYDMMRDHLKLDYCTLSLSKRAPGLKLPTILATT